MKLSLFAAACGLLLTITARPAEATSDAWMCVPKAKVPMRVVNGDIECASINGRDCLWDACPGSDAPAAPWEPKVPLRKLACGADHAAKYSGKTGYDTPDHWCKTACDRSASCVATWRCVPGIKTPVRMWNGDLQCASLDGRNCVWDACSGAPGKTTLWTAPAPLAPLGCGADHKAKYGTTGYDTPNHWCAVGCKGIAGCNAKR